MKRVHILDYMKLVCAVLVIVIHTIDRDGIGIYIKALCRIAVPLFAMCSGYFLSKGLSGENKNRFKYLVKYVVRLFLLEAIWSVPYLIIEWKEFFTGNAWYKIVYSIVVVFWKRGIETHLWYLSALAVCALLLYWAIPRLKWIVIEITAVGFYAFCLLGDSYYEIIRGGVAASPLG